ncbi:MAG: hypothetical protein KDN22_19460 [Verrucomicrobiae bacterium]|nr:hypothetical protein [Verrucomicrobiae bacterium]
MKHCYVKVTRGLAALALALPPSSHAEDVAEVPPPSSVALGIEGTRFTLNASPTFLLGFSYYGALGAKEEFVKRDLRAFNEHGFNWLRVWATWNAFDHETAAFDTQGRVRKPMMNRLKMLVQEADALGMVVDVTLHRGEELPTFEAHLAAVEYLVDELEPWSNWYLDLANERDVGDGRFVSIEELRKMRDRVRELDPKRIVTASFGGHDLSKSDVRQILVGAGADFLAPHRPRHPKSSKETEAKAKQCLAFAKELGRPVPVHFQEPFRRGYTDWQPVAQDFLTDLKGAHAGGAAGWCFHNGATRGVNDERPRRSFDLTEASLIDQLDAEERAFVFSAKE